MGVVTLLLEREILRGKLGEHESPTSNFCVIMPKFPAAALEEQDFSNEEQDLLEIFAAEKPDEDGNSGTAHEGLSSQTEGDEDLFLLANFKGDGKINGDLFFPKIKVPVDLGLILSNDAC